MLQRTRKWRSSAELREMLGLQRLPSGAIAVADGEWRREGQRWRFWASPAHASDASGRASRPAARQWWDDI